MIKTKKSIKGFSLLELAIVVTIIGVSVGAGLTVLSQYSESSKITQTKIRLQEIMDAIDDYADEFNRLPCPADATALFENPTYGAESYSSACDSETLSSGGSPNIVMGMIPTKDLNLYPSMALDAWGNRFTYIINENIAQADGLEQASIDLDLYDYYGYTRFDDIVVIVMSHGANGYGAYRGRGGSNRIDPSGGSTQETRNNDPADDFLCSLSVAGFDDILYYKTIYQITDPSMEK